MVTQAPDQCEYACPDCGANPELTPGSPPILTCDPTCPNLAAVTERQRLDAEFFEQRPALTEFWRPATWAERTTLIASGVPSEAARTARMRVVQVKPGFRLRQAFVTAVTE